MMAWLGTPVFVLSALILLVLAARALYVMRQENLHESTRGSLPGKGEHILTSDYNSGGGGGGGNTSYTVPKDPQAYARHLVPLHARPKVPKSKEE